MNVAIFLLLYFGIFHLLNDVRSLGLTLLEVARPGDINPVHLTSLQGAALIIRIVTMHRDTWASDTSIAICIAM